MGILNCWGIVWDKIFQVRWASYGHDSVAKERGGMGDCLALLDLSQRKRFCKSQLTSIVAIGLQKPYDKTKVGKSCTCMMFIDSVVVDNGIKIPGIHFQDQNNKHSQISY
jgi:hypothetical protein